MSPAEREVRRHARRVAQATEARDAAMAAMHAEGASLRAIAAAAGLSHQGVKDVLTRRGTYEG